MRKLTKGLWWARHAREDHVTRRQEWTRWVVVEVDGQEPFLTAMIVFDPSVGGCEPYLSFSNHIDKWQFGPRLNLPDRNYAEEVTPEHEPI